LYEAFRRRRLLHSRRVWWSKSGIASSVLGWAAVFGIFGYLVLLVILIKLLGAIAPVIGVAIFVGGASLFISGTGIRGPDSWVLPRTIREVFVVNATNRNAALDIWMTGATGRDIAEAVYLEVRERQDVVSLVLSSIGAVIILVIYFAVFGAFQPGTVLLVPVLAWTWWVGFRVMLVMGASTAAMTSASFVRYWKSRGTPSGEALLKLIRSAVRLVRAIPSLPARLWRWLCGFAAVGLWRIRFRVLARRSLIAALLVAGLWFLVTSRTGGQFWSWFGAEFTLILNEIGWQWNVPCLLLVLAILLYRLLPRMLEGEHRRLDKALSQATEAFNRFMVVSILEDTDAATWIREVYGEL
ncbi:hypothetical protein HZA57_03655, partial [Candidatus Poribacteria bacterium]|nr:hypothetical protein [Candidatus Poribacteria bacterium]